ncbi:branched-chain amino acid ABC transporter permease [Undibacterium sp. SXout7W]|uniref:branched-chain amino acid ABC transporter permease n=1 Tax=Undibacterium sp. SXout7W TaxID=3413049 RepID=UPI003BF1AD1A
MKTTQWIIAGLLACVAVIAPHLLKNYGIYLLSYWLIYVIATMGLNLIVGYAGQKALGQAAFLGIGAYTTALMLNAGWSFWLAMPASAALSFVVGLLIGFPALRVQMVYLAFATLGFNELVSLFMRNEEWLTGGTFGISGIPRPSLFGLSLESNIAYYYLVLACTVLLSLLLWGILRSPWGKAFTALRDNPIRAESLGINIQRYTLLSFAIGSAFAGVAGALFASLVQFIEPSPFSSQISIMMYLMVVIGGPGYMLGPLVGAAIGVLAPEALRFAEGWYLFVFGAMVIILMVWLPGGLLSIPDLLRAKRQSREASAARTAASAAASASAISASVSTSAKGATA